VDRSVVRGIQRLSDKRTTRRTYFTRFVPLRPTTTASSFLGVGEVHKSSIGRSVAKQWHMSGSRQEKPKNQFNPLLIFGQACSVNVLYHDRSYVGTCSESTRACFHTCLNISLPYRDPCSTSECERTGRIDSRLREGIRKL